MNNNCDDIPKYKKKKESSTSKYKHDYSKECLLITGENKRPHHATYCSICGKIENVKFFETVKDDSGYYRVLDTDEVYEKYQDLEKIYVDDVWQKYVPISEGSEEWMGDRKRNYIKTDL